MKLSLKILALVQKLDDLNLAYCDWKIQNIGYDEKDDLIKIIDADDLKWRNEIEGVDCDKECYGKYGCEMY